MKKLKKVTVPALRKMKERSERIAALTAYGYPMARLLDEAGIPLILVGDSVGMVEAGYDSTLPVTVDEIVYHTRAVARGAARALVVADMPFMSYQVSLADARRNAGRLVKEASAGAVKVEGGARSAGVIRALAEIEIPVMGHVGLTPQSVLRLGGYKVQGCAEEEAEMVLADALAVEEAGAFSVVLEGIPMKLAERITASLEIPTIGIGAGAGTDGQILVLNDMLGLNVGDGVEPRFVKRYARLAEVTRKAVGRYRDEVERGKFPTKKHSY